MRSNEVLAEKRQPNHPDELKFQFDFTDFSLSEIFKTIEIFCRSVQDYTGFR